MKYMAMVIFKKRGLVNRFDLKVSQKDHLGNHPKSKADKNRILSNKLSE